MISNGTLSVLGRKGGADLTVSSSSYFDNAFNVTEFCTASWKSGCSVSNMLSCLPQGTTCGGCTMRVCATAASDVITLRAFNATTNWPLSTDPCTRSWSSVKCTSNRVSSLDLSSIPFSSSISALNSLGSLKNLSLGNVNMNESSNFGMMNLSSLSLVNMQANGAWFDLSNATSMTSLQLKGVNSSALLMPSSLTSLYQFLLLFGFY